MSFAVALRNGFLKPFGKNSQKGKQKGMTLLEIIIVIALLGTLMTILIRTITSASDEAKRDAAELGMGTVAQSLQYYKVHNNRFPTTSEGLEALLKNPGSKRWRGPYIEENKLKDPWDNDYKYDSDGKVFKLTSAGPDLQFGTADDIIYPRDSSSESGSGSAPAEDP